MSKLIKTRYPGVFRDNSTGKFVLRVGVRVKKKVITKVRTLPAGTSLEEAVRTALRIKVEIQEAAMADLSHCAHPLGTSLTLEHYARRWLAGRSERLQPSTQGRYLETLGLHILPHLGHLPVQYVTREAVQAWVAWAENVRKPNGAPYSPQTIAGWYRVLCTMLADMAADHHLPDPTTRVPEPRIQAAPPSREQRTLSLAELRAFVAAAAEATPAQFAAIYVLAYTGMRAGEAFGLLWECVDFSGKEIIVRRSAARGILSDSTKTKEARILPMPEPLADVLQAHRQAMIREQHPALRRGLVFGTRKRGKLKGDGSRGVPGSPLLAQSLTRPMRRASVAAGLAIVVTPQVLRRTFNTLLRKTADDLTIRRMMGHSSAEIQDHYTHTSYAEKAAAVATLFE